MFCQVCQLPVAEAAHRSHPAFGVHECQFCSARFSRVDGARRHARNCPKRAGRELQGRRRGRRAKSCGQCSRLKVHCNTRDNGPCERCVSRSLDCTFMLYCTNAAHRQAHYHGDANSPSSFLLNVFDEKQDFITEREVGEEPDGAPLGPACVSPPQARLEASNGFIDPIFLLPFANQAYLRPFEPYGLYDTEEQDILSPFFSPSPQEIPTSNKLSARLDLLESQLAAHASSKNSEPLNLTDFRRFFTVSNVQKFATVFCRKRHYQYPIIHWPTFRLEEASVPLLLVVSLTGAAYSYPTDGPEYITDARKLYHLADSYVFHQLATRLTRLPLDADENCSHVIQLCQAALLMYALDTLMAGGSAIRKVAVTKRLPALVAALRRLHFMGCRHLPAEDWQLFIQREHIVRLVTWTFCSDCILTLACNNPPIISMMEMIGDLPCDTALWDAESATAFEMLRSRHQQKKSSCLKDLMSSFLRDDRYLEVQDVWEDLPLFHLHVMLCAFQHIIFNLHVTMCLEQQSQKILRALSTWGCLWERAIGKIPVDLRKWLGVSNHVSDLAYISRRIVEVAISPEAGSCRYLQRIPTLGASGEMHEFVCKFASKT